jgi:phospholipid/cholesterol/gamma-HCH transport system substrate-binding protein
MAMKSRKVELLVGVFVALTIAAGLMLALNVANQSMSSSEDT